MVTRPLVFPVSAVREDEGGGWRDEPVRPCGAQELADRAVPVPARLTNAYGT